VSAAASRLQDLRAELARIERGLAGVPLPVLRLCDAIDQHLPEQGLPRSALHEIQASDPGAGLALCALLLSRTEGQVVWIAPRPDAIWAPGLQALGLDVSRLILACYRKPQDGLWTMEEALRCPAIGGVVLRLDQLDLTASRRLQLAAENHGSFGLLLRTAAAGQGPSSATTRWRTTSLPHPAARPHWQIELLRCRGGQPAAWQAEWQAGALWAEPSSLSSLR
jgi:protein ImuA